MKQYYDEKATQDNIYQLIHSIQQIHEAFEKKAETNDVKLNKTIDESLQPSESLSDDENDVKLNTTIDESLKLSASLSSAELEITAEQNAHFKKSAELLKDILEIQKQIINIEIKKIDPKAQGFASRQSNRLYEQSAYLKKQIGFDSNDENILMGILKAVFKPINSFLGIFRAITPDKWRVASTKERVKLVVGLSLTVIGIGAIIAAIVLGLAVPLAIATGVGATVVYGPVALGLAAVFSLGMGGAFLGKVSKVLSAKFGEKQQLTKLQSKCDKAVTALDNKIKAVAVVPTVKFEESPRKTVVFSEKPEKLQEVEKTIATLKNKLRVTAERK